MQAATRLLSGTLIPIVFFPDIIAKLFNFLPFSSITSTPTLIYLGKLSSIEIIKGLSLQVVWIVIFYFVSKWIWNKLIKQVTILGG